MPSLASKLGKSGKVREPRQPLWKGPEVDGITQSMLARFLVCRERFRIHVIEGLRPTDSFNHRLEYGNMWHVCEETVKKSGGSWLDALYRYSVELIDKYPHSSEQISHWHRVCAVQFPWYLAYWKTHEDVVERKPIVQEYVFGSLYELPSGRKVLLRGKYDSVDLVGKGKQAALYLQENKTKGDVDERKLTQQLTFDLQTMFYLVALYAQQNLFGKEFAKPIRGVIYNVVRRPLSGGKGNIVRHRPTKSKPKGESLDEFYDRLGGIIGSDPERYFMRWKVEVYPGEIMRFRRECLDPVLEQLWDWWESVSILPPSPSFCSHLHFRFPYGVYNPMLEDRSSDLDEYLATGSEVGLSRVGSLFPELE